MSLLSGQDLIEAGWTEEQLPDLLAEVEMLEAKGIPNPKYILKLLKKKFPQPDRRLPMREQPLVWGEAIEAVTDADADNVASVRRYMHDLMRCPVIEGGAIMPDACPAGNTPATIPVGGVIAARNAILPGAHGADICCSLLGTFFTADTEDVAFMMDELMDSTRFGPGGRHPSERVHHRVLEEPVWQNKFLTGLQDHAAAHMADQGDGNHFAFIGRVRFPEAALDRIRAAGHEDFARSISEQLGAGRDCYALVTHHGSRGLGAQLYKRGIKAAEKFTEEIAKDVPQAAAWLSLETEQGAEYWEALSYVGRWTRANHQTIHDRFLERIDGAALTSLSTEHNFVWQRGELFLHGKGATPAWKDESGKPLMGLIPLNMASPILMVMGRDNPDYLSFAPHGAGRNFSRRALVRQFRQKDGMMDFAAMNQAMKRSTEGIEVRWFLGQADYTECPPGYKPPAQVRSQIEQFGLADVLVEFEPLGSIMAGRHPERGEEPLTPKQTRQIQHRADRRKLRQQLRQAEIPDDEEA